MVAKSAWRIIAIGLVGLLILLGAVWIGATHYIADEERRADLYRSQVEVRLQPGFQEVFAMDGLNGFVCGSSSPLAAEGRAQACIGFFADGKFYLVDIGSGAWRNIELWGIPVDRFGGVFLTHFHSDHFGDLAQANVQSLLAGRQGHLPVFGPPGVEEIVDGLNAAYRQDTAYRSGHGDPSTYPVEDATMVAKPLANGDVISLGDVQIQAFSVAHEPVTPAFGYKLARGDRVAIVSGDTARSENLIRFARNADLLIHEAQNMEMIRAARSVAKDLDQVRHADLLEIIQEYHTDPADVVDIARQAKVDNVILYHLAPPPVGRLAEFFFLYGVEGDPIIAHDGMVFQLPAETSRLEIRDIGDLE